MSVAVWSDPGAAARGVPGGRQKELSALCWEASWVLGEAGGAACACLCTPSSHAAWSAAAGSGWMAGCRDAVRNCCAWTTLCSSAICTAPYNIQEIAGVRGMELCSLIGAVYPLIKLSHQAMATPPPPPPPRLLLLESSAAHGWCSCL